MVERVSQTTTALPDREPPFLSFTEWRLIEGCELNGPLAIRHALTRNGIDDLSACLDELAEIEERRALDDLTAAVVRNGRETAQAFDDLGASIADGIAAGLAQPVSRYDRIAGWLLVGAGLVAFGGMTVLAVIRTVKGV